MTDLLVEILGEEDVIAAADEGLDGMVFPDIAHGDCGADVPGFVLEIFGELLVYLLL